MPVESWLNVNIKNFIINLTQVKVSLHSLRKMDGGLPEVVQFYDYGFAYFWALQKFPFLLFLLFHHFLFLLRLRIILN